MTAAVSRIIAGAASTALLACLGLTGIAPAVAEDAPVTIPVMGDFVASDYVAAAGELPDELVVAINRDLGQSAEQYLAESDAAVQASDVLEGLSDAGVDVLGSRMDGTELVVHVGSDGDAAAVDAVGAIVEWGAPEPFVLPQGQIEWAEDLYGGQGYVWPVGGGNSLCSVGFNGFAVATGAPQYATAGHCTDGVGGALTKTISVTGPGSGGSIGVTIGGAVAGTTLMGEGYDVGRIAVTGSSVSPKPGVATWGGGTGAPLASAPRLVTRVSAAIDGAMLCKSGATSGWTCGVIVLVDYPIEVDDAFVVNSIVAEICVLPGDSGGSALIGTSAVGITSWRLLDPGDAGSGPCPSFTYGGFFPMESSSASLQTAYGAGWEAAVSVSTPTASFSGTGDLTTTLSGSLANASGPSTVSVYIDGSSTPTTVSASGGTWSVPLSAVAAGLHSFRAEGGYGAWSEGRSLTGWFTKGVQRDRITGADRYAVGIAIAKKLFPTPAAVPVVYITTGRNFPDALSAAPAAAFQGGPLLLTDPAALPASIKAEIERLHPARIVVVGGVNSVSMNVQSQLLSILNTLTPDTDRSDDVSRLGGTDRYDASRNIVRSAFAEPGATTAYIATGANFPDALSASGAGGAFGIPVILVQGTALSLDPATRQLLIDLGVANVKIAGGPNSVSVGIQGDLSAEWTTTRLPGLDRFDASKNIAIDAFTASTPTEVFIATGFNFPDALSGAVLAGERLAPLIVVPTDCIPAATLEAIKNFGSTTVTLLGGPVSLTANVLALRSC